MKKLSFYLVILLSVFLGIIFFHAALNIERSHAIQPAWSVGINHNFVPPQNLIKNTKQSESSEASENQENSQLQPFDQVIKNTEKSAGLFTIYREKSTGRIFLGIQPEQLNKNYLATITLTSGIGERGVYSGLSMQDFLFYFRRVNRNLHFAVRNVNFRTNPQDPQARSLDRSFSDSVLYSLPIKSIHPQQKTILVDLGDLLLKDLPDLSSMLRESLDGIYKLDVSKSYFGDTQVFPLNVEIDSVYGFSLLDNNERANLATLPDSRGLTLKVHYSFSQLPENNGYRHRLADDRVGYFHTAYKDFSDNTSRDPFVRYINRWHLEKQDPKASISPPKKPIVFWIENTVPLEYRAAIGEGVLMWNKAFEKAGFKDAIEVRQMPDNATWNPADLRYNTIRWFNSLDAAFASGPMRSNPLTGEILDADIVVDANFVRAIKRDYRTFFEQINQSGTNTVFDMCGENLFSGAPQSFNLLMRSHSQDRGQCYSLQATNQVAIGSLALSLFPATPTNEQMKAYIDQFLRSLIAHEVGHTLGLRHNFRASTLLKPEELNNTNITRTKGMVSSVMDYVPVNLARFNTQQGDYFPTIVGPYDEWAIEYGYKPSTAVTNLAEKPELQQIAQRQAGKPELSYAPDEDSFDLDPTVNRFDMSSDPLLYSQWQLDNARILWDRINKQMPTTNESYSELTEEFDSVFFYYLRQVNFITKYIGGQSFYRNRPEKDSQRLPFVPISAVKQREALTLLQKYVFAEEAFQFPPELLNKLAPSRWYDWGNDVAVARLDYPIHDRVFFQQSVVLRRLLSGDRLSRLRDIELKTPPSQALTLPELFNTLQTGIWGEILNEKLTNISSLRRALQREHLRLLMGMVLRTDNVPEDARSLAWLKLKQLRESVDRKLKKGRKDLDDYTKAHLEETRDRITKTLDAPLPSKSNVKGKI